LVLKAFETGSSAIKPERQPLSSGFKRETVKARLRQYCCADVGHGIDTGGPSYGAWAPRIC
jgi:hypothetical protein